MKFVTLLAIAFVGYYLLTAPAGAAEAVKTAVGAVGVAFEQVMRFFEELAS